MNITAPPIRAVSVAAIVAGRVLLVERAKEPSKGMFAFPGGRVEKGESLEVAARRELLEETGLTAGHLEVLAEYDLIGEESSYALAVFLTYEVSGDLCAADDAASAVFYTREEISRLPMSESMKDGISRILARLRD